MTRMLDQMKAGDFCNDVDIEYTDDVLQELMVKMVIGKYDAETCRAMTMDHRNCM